MSNQNQAQDENNAVDPMRPGKHVPSWKDLELFLEGEVTIRVHAEKRGEISNQQKENVNQFSHGKKFKKVRSNFGRNSNPNGEKCVVCPGTNALYHCDVFKAMNLMVKQKVKAYLKPWFKSNLLIPIEFFVLSKVSGTYPVRHIEASNK